MAAPTTPKSHQHVAVVPLPTGSHPSILFSLARAMAAAAPECAFSFISTPGSVSSLSKVPARPDNLRLRCMDDGSSASDLRQEGERVRTFLRVAAGSVRAGIEAAAVEEGTAVTCVVSDAFLSTAMDAAEEKGLSWVAVWLPGPSSLMAYIYTEELRSVFGVAEAIHPRADETLGVVAPALASFHVRDLPGGILSKSGGMFPDVLYSAVKSLPRASAVAFNTFQGLDPLFDAEFESRFRKSVFVGPFNLLSPPDPPRNDDDDDECMAWLDTQGAAGTVTYVGFGKVALMPESELAELAHGLEASGTPFLWSLKNEEALPAGFLERTKGKGLVVAWAPQERVLGHEAVGAFVTHGGWTSLLESISSGVPMICRPFFADQGMITRCVCHVWKIGLELEGRVVTRGELVGALDKLLTGEGGGREVRERCREFKRRAWQAVAAGGCSRENLTALLDIVRGGN